MKPYSVTRRLIAAVLLMELLSALALIWLAVRHERHSRFRSFDESLRAHAATLFGAVGDADDPSDNIVLDLHGIDIPAADLFDVEGSGSNVLGRSHYWPAQQIDAQLDLGSKDGIYPVTLGHLTYHFVILHAVRVVDPGAKESAVMRPVVVRYGVSTERVWSEVWEAVRFYAVASLILLTATAFALTWFLRHSLAPLAELASEASKISAQQWRFHPHERAHAMAELAPLTYSLEAALKRLQSSFDQQRRLTSDAAHELKTDLAIAKSSLQLLAMRKRSPEEYERGLEVCLNDTLRLEQTVAQMLTLARVEYAESPAPAAAEHRPLADLTMSLDQAVRQLESLAELRQVVVRVDSPARAGVSTTDEDARLLCTNLLLNAIQHSRPFMEVQATVRESEGWVTMVVKDQGVGISPSSIPHVFEPFYRGDTARDRRTGGTGLGLAICKGVCEKAGGSISIRSQLNEGTDVTVRMPAVKLP